MKKYNTPEIEALALETVDVIATSGDDAAAKLLKETYASYEEVNVQDGGELKNFNGAWSW